MRPVSLEIKGRSTYCCSYRQRPPWQTDLERQRDTSPGRHDCHRQFSIEQEHSAAAISATQWDANVSALAQCVSLPTAIWWLGRLAWSISILCTESYARAFHGSGDGSRSTWLGSQVPQPLTNVVTGPEVTMPTTSGSGSTSLATSGTGASLPPTKLPLPRPSTATRRMARPQKSTRSLQQAASNTQGFFRRRAVIDEQARDREQDREQLRRVSSCGASPAALCPVPDPAQGATKVMCRQLESRCLDLPDAGVDLGPALARDMQTTLGHPLQDTKCVRLFQLRTRTHSVSCKGWPRVQDSALLQGPDCGRGGAL
ncbi:hypothetical protein WJX79_006515 [Trebouxia sp. C0005]